MQKRKIQFGLDQIAILHTCFKEKFGVPRQPGLVTSAHGLIKFENDPDLRTAIRGFEGFSHLWVVFIFHDRRSRTWKPSVRPPRLGGAKRIGVLASRSPHRPNPIGLSVVKIVECRPDAEGGAEIEVSGVDILDGTPVLDIKPYLAYADSIPDALSGWALEAIARVPVSFSEAGEASLKARAQSYPPGYEQLRKLIVEMVELDPRPAFQKTRLPPSHPGAEGTRYGFKLLDFDVQWEIRDGAFQVLELQNA